MGKSLYSLVLMDEVVKEIDRLALAQNTNRSNLVNQILAEYVSYITPEKRINSIFKSIEELMNVSGMVPYVMPHQSTMSLKSSLDYRYRPTVKYDVELFKADENGCIGRISVIFRTQARDLLDKLTDFFNVWCRVECALRQNPSIKYTLYEGRLIRTVVAEDNFDYTVSSTANAISQYIKLFDECLNDYLNGKADEDSITVALLQYINKEVLI